MSMHVCVCVCVCMQACMYLRMYVYVRMHACVRACNNATQRNTMRCDAMQFYASLYRQIDQRKADRQRDVDGNATIVYV